MSLDDHAEELASDLGVDKAEVKQKLENMTEYNVPMAEAKQSVRRSYGATGSDSDVPQKDLAEVTTADNNVATTAEVLSVGKRSIQYSGEKHVIFEGKLADETGKISYTAWNDFGLEPGETVEIENAGIREWEGSPELNLGDSTDIDRVEESLSTPYDVGGDTSLESLEPGDRGVNLEVRVLESESKVIDGREGETEILSGVLGDGSTRLPFTDWEPRPEISEGASVRLEDTFVREFQGVPSVNLSEFTAVRELDRRVEVTESAPHRSVGDAVDEGGLFDVELAGNVVAVRDGSGLIERCPECGRVVQSGQCRAHGEVDAEDDLRTKAILDDGTGTVTVVLDEALTAEVYGGDIDDAREHARDAMDREVVADAIREEVVGRAFRVRGSLSVDEYGANLDAESFAEDERDPETRASRLLEEVEA